MKYFQKCPKCLGKAWQYKSKPRAGQVMYPQNVIHADNPKPLDVMTCQICKYFINGGKLNKHYLIIED